MKYTYLRCGFLKLGIKLLVSFTKYCDLTIFLLRQAYQLNLANQLTGFYMRATLAFNGLILSFFHEFVTNATLTTCGKHLT